MIVPGLAIDFSTLTNKILIKKKLNCKNPKQFVLE